MLVTSAIEWTLNKLCYCIVRKSIRPKAQPLIKSWIALPFFISNLREKKLSQKTASITMVSGSTFTHPDHEQESMLCISAFQSYHFSWWIHFSWRIFFGAWFQRNKESGIFWLNFGAGIKKEKLNLVFKLSGQTDVTIHQWAIITTTATALNTSNPACKLALFKSNK